MLTCDEHENDPDPQRPRGSASCAQGARRSGGKHSLGLHPRRASPHGRQADAGAGAGAHPTSQPGRRPVGSRGDPSRARLALMLVIDASATADLLLARPAAETLAKHIADHRSDLHAPHLLDIEVVSAVRRLVASGHASAARGIEAITDLLDLPLI